MNIGIVSDHGGYELKQKLTKYLLKNGYNIKDYGTHSLESVDYPDYAFLLGEKIINKECDYGIAICKSGIGMSIACNKVKGIMCAKIDSIKDARLSKEDNGANVITLNSSKSFFIIKKMVLTYLKSESLIAQRHKDRINKIIKYENEH